MDGSDSVGDPDTHHSTFGYHVQIANGPVSWQSKKQKTVALSSTEAENIGAANVTEEIIWLRHLLSKIGFAQPLPTLIYCNNQTYLALTRNPRFHDRSKHIEL